jgi:hypothetical protein
VFVLSDHAGDVTAKDTHHPATSRLAMPGPTVRAGFIEAP